ncbi:hypothetical protein [Bacillus sp. J33]|uniref:hypothetical protein n=1 Tax=Bacillus sp. J33 TaxID=935836 RepID=UPI0004B0C71B|nr:hypothetical protein [Bacillus sp. J33]
MEKTLYLLIVAPVAIFSIYTEDSPFKTAIHLLALTLALAVKLIFYKKQKGAE